MATTTLMSFGEFERLDFGADKVELLNGELIRTPPAKLGYNQIAQKLFLSLHGAIESLRQSSPDFHLGSANHEMGYCLSREPGKWLQPDVSITHAGQAADEDYYPGLSADCIRGHL